MGLILAVVLIVLLFGGLPAWNYHSFGYYPSGVIAIVLVMLVLLMLMGRL